MDAYLLIILVESFILLAIVIGFLFIQWRNSTKTNAQIEHFLDQFESQETERKAKLIEQLTGKNLLQQDNALQLSEQLIAVEKQFLYESLELWLNQRPVSAIYDQVCSLLDNYLELVTDETCSAAHNAADEKSASELSDIVSSEGEEDSGQEQPTANIDNDEIDEFNAI